MADPDSPAPQLQPHPSRAPAVDPHPALRSKPKPSAAAGSGPHAPDAPTPIDATRTAGLLMRAAAAAAAAALASAGPTRQARLVEAATRVASALHEVAALSALQPIAWRELPGELAAFLASSQQLGATLRAAGIAALDAELAAGAARLEADVGPRDRAAAAARGQAAPPPALSYPERVALARLALAAATRQTALVREVNRSPATTQDADRDALIRIVRPVQAHLAAAIDAALDVSDSRGFEMLIPDAEVLSAELTLLAHRLSHAPRLPWHLAFASVFDAENQLRATIGLDRKPRPYTGTIDPHAAMTLVGQKTRPDPDPDSDPDPDPRAGSRSDPHAPPGSAGRGAYTDPQAAVNGIAARTSHLFLERIEGVRRLRSDLEEPPPAKQQSAFEVLLELATNVVLTAVSGGLGALVAGKLRIALEGAASSAAAGLAAGEVGRLSEAARASLIGSKNKDGALRRAVLADTAKDGTKQLFIESTTRALASTRPHAINAARPLCAYTQHLEQVLRAAQYEAAILMTHTAGALGQLDLATLDRFAGSLDGVHAEANHRQYDASLREWQNVRANLAAPSFDSSRRGDPDLEGPRKNVSHDEPISGVLEIGLEVDRGFGGPLVGLKYLVLRDGEPAAIRHLKAHPRRLPDTGLNRQYQLSFLGADSWAKRPDGHVYGGQVGLPGFAKVGVGARHGFQPGSLTLQERRLLKLFASRPVTALGLLDAYLRESYDQVPDARAIALVQEIIAEVDHVTTARLEG